MSATTVELNPGTGGAKELHDALATVDGAAAPADAVSQVVKLAFGAAGDATQVSAATPMPVAGPLTDAQLRATAVPVDGPLTDSQLRAAVIPVSVSGVATAAAQATAIAGIASIDSKLGAALPLPTGAATALLQADGNGSLASMDAKMPALASGLVPVTNPTALPLPAGAATEATILAVLARMGLLATTTPTDTTAAAPVRQVPADLWRCSFSEVGAGLVSSDLAGLQIGAGQTVNQSGGNLVITSGTTANAETLIRSARTFRGGLQLRQKTTLSQRIANQNFSVELADLVGESLAFTINSATSVTVEFPAVNPFTAANVGQSMNLSAITGAAGIPGRFAIASVAGLTVTFTVAAWPATGSGTLTLWGWNYYRQLYTGTTATNLNWDAQRKGWASGDTVATISTTAAPGHVAQMQTIGTIAVLSDAVVASNAAYQVTPRASRIENLPNDDQELYLWVRCLNGSTAPASTTTWTLGFISVEMMGRNKVYIAGADQGGAPMGMSVKVDGTTTVSGTVGVTGYPTAAASADALANPTVTQIGADSMLFNGTTWDRKRGNWNVNTGDTGAKTASFAGATQTNFNANGATIVINMGVVSGTTPTLTAQVQGSADGGTTWFNIPGAATPSITATGATVLCVAPGVTPAANAAVSWPLPRTWRLNYTIAGTTPSFTITNVQVAYHGG